jgi:hypothetical protein
VPARVPADMGGNPVASIAACAAPERADLCAAHARPLGDFRRPVLPTTGSWFSLAVTSVTGVSSVSGVTLLKFTVPFATSLRMASASVFRSSSERISERLVSEPARSGGSGPGWGLRLCFAIWFRV